MEEVVEFVICVEKVNLLCVLLYLLVGVTSSGVFIAVKE